jgi:hypothetical protein
LGIARIMQCGWYKEVRVKSFDGHTFKALLTSRALLVTRAEEEAVRKGTPNE